MRCFLFSGEYLGTWKSSEEGAAEWQDADSNAALIAIHLLPQLATGYLPSLQRAFAAWGLRGGEDESVKLVPHKTVYGGKRLSAAGVRGSVVFFVKSSIFCLGWRWPRGSDGVMSLKWRL